MKLPNGKNAYIPSSKLSDYLLSKTHPIGKWKGRLFRAHGFNETNVDLLEKSLISIANYEDLKDVVRSEHGTKYIIDGSVQTPVGSSIRVRTIWIIEVEQDRPRFVTAYPL